MDGTTDVLVIGGGAAGLSGALVLGRAGRSVVVVDAGSPRNAPAAGVHGFLTRDGMPPERLLAIGAAEVEGYGGRIVRAGARSARRTDDGFAVTLDDGSELTARRLLLTTGLVDELPDVPGVREQWGRSVVHCPYCHGAEHRGEPVGILGTSPMAVHGALLWRQWTPDVVLFVHTAPEPTADELEQLDARGIRVVRGLVEALDTDDGRLTGVRLADGTVVPRSAVVVAPRFVARPGLLDDLGLAKVQHPMGVGEHVPVTDPTGRTAVPGVWVAGNVTDLMAQVVTSAAAGVAAAAMMNWDLVAEDTQRAVSAARATRSVGAA